MHMLPCDIRGRGGPFVLLMACLAATTATASAETDTAQLETTSMAKQAAPSPVDCVNPLIGTALCENKELFGPGKPPEALVSTVTGMIYPGPSMPNGMVQLSPINTTRKLEKWGDPWGSGYIYQETSIMGFAHTNRGGHWDYHVFFMPTVGPLKTVPGPRDKPGAGYRSTFSHQTEKASAGYYTVVLADYKVKVELTATSRVGFHRYTFPKSDQAHVLVDLGNGRGTSEVKIVGKNRVEGHEGNIYFSAEFSKEFSGHGTWKDGAVSGGADSASGASVGAYVDFATADGEAVLVKVGLSRVSVEQARKNLAAEVTGWDFDGAVSAARKVWSERLGTIDVEGGTREQRAIFYTCLYRALQHPGLISDVDGKWTDRRGGVHQSDRPVLDEPALWDVHRNGLPLVGLIEPEVRDDILQSMTLAGGVSGWMPNHFHGDHADSVFAEAILQGSRNFDIEAAYKLMHKNATAEGGPRQFNAEYDKLGYIPLPRMACTAKTLEFAYDDYCLAQIAKALGKDDDYKFFIKRAGYYKNVFDAATGFMRGKNADGSWAGPLKPQQSYDEHIYREASAWQTVWSVQHDVAGLISLMGGREKFVRKLDEFFSTPYMPEEYYSAWIAGMVGQYCHGNQPDHHAAYLYDYAGAPWKTQEAVRKIMHLMYGVAPQGLAWVGMDDQGEMSAWYVWSAMGFYPVAPGQIAYPIGSPIFSKVTIHLPKYLHGGKDFTVEARNVSDANMYIQSATLDGQPFTRAWISYKDMVGGGSLVFEMGPKPSSWGSGPEDAPPSMSAQ